MLRAAENSTGFELEVVILARAKGDEEIRPPWNVSVSIATSNEKEGVRDENDCRSKSEGWMR